MAFELDRSGRMDIRYVQQPKELILGGRLITGEVSGPQNKPPLLPRLWGTRTFSVNLGKEATVADLPASRPFLP